MILEIVITFFIGVLAGTITGLIPGIHINLVATILLSTLAITSLPINQAITFIVAMAITHTFIDFIPSVYAGAPDSDTALSTLPGHKFLAKGLGHHAILLTLTGSIISIILLLLIIPLFIFAIPKIYPFIQKMLGFLLVWISIFLITQKKEGRLQSLIIFILAGFLGIGVLNANIKDPLLPLLSGLFGASTIINSIKANSIIPKQIISKYFFSKKEIIKPIVVTTIISPICALFPGLGSSQAAIIGSKLIKNITREEFLILMGSINTLIMASSFFILFILQKSRTGAANAISQIGSLNQSNIILISIVILFSSIVAIPLTIEISKTCAKHIHKINYQKLSILILGILTIVVFLFSGYLGLLIFSISTVLGLTCIEFGASKSLLMAALLVPTILFYLPF